jgi:hypothetical protein
MLYSTGNPLNIVSDGQPIKFIAGTAERMRIDSSGNVGIGTSSPTSKLDVNSTVTLSGAENSQLRWLNSGKDWRANTSAGGNWYLYDATNNKFPFTIVGNAPSNAFYMTSAGDVGIGTNTPGQKLEVNGITKINTASAVWEILQLVNTQGASGAYMQMVGAPGGSVAIGADATVASTMIFRTAGAEKARISAAGLVGIGTSSPQVALHVSFADQSTNRIRLQNTGSGGGNFDIIGGLAGASNAGLSFYDVTNAATRMVIDSSGNLLVGTTTATNTPSQGITLMQNTNIGSIGIGHASGTADGNGYLQFAFNGTSIGSVTQSGSGTAVLYNLTSDARLKENVADADDAASLIDALQVRKFDWKAGGEHQRYGFIAQELVTVAPEAVSQPEDQDAMMGVDYSKLVPMLVKEVQSLRARVAELEGK